MINFLSIFILFIYFLNEFIDYYILVIFFIDFFGYGGYWIFIRSSFLIFNCLRN